jgi:L-amino acid N-acyltransferase YncA
MRSYLKNFVSALFRFANGWRRPTKAANERALCSRGETLESFAIREAVPEDLPALAALHVRTWADTYPDVKQPPSFALRERQWREQFQVTDGSWFCFVVANQKDELIGFAKGTMPSSADSSDGSGQLSKIYLLREYQRLGLGRRLVGYVARRFLSKGIHSMVLFGTPQNPSCAFHEALGGERMFAENGEFHGGYRWPDLKRLASICPTGEGAHVASGESRT